MPEVGAVLDEYDLLWFAPDELDELKLDCDCSRNRADIPFFLTRSSTKSASTRPLVQTGGRDLPTLAIRQ